MSALAIGTALDLLLRYGPTAVDLGLKLKAAVDAGRAGDPLTAADWAEMRRLAEQSGEDIYRRLGITPPPPAAGAAK